MAAGKAKVGNILERVLSLFPGRTGPRIVNKRSRAASVDVDRFAETSGVGQSWARTAYGEYYATSVPIYSAIRIRSEALARPKVTVLRRTAGDWLPVGDDHPAQRLMDSVNGWQTRGELWRATETYLNLWGSAFWALERDERGQWEIWTLRPDRMRVLPDKGEIRERVRVHGGAGPGRVHR